MSNRSNPPHAKPKKTESSDAFYAYTFFRFGDRGLSSEEEYLLLLLPERDPLRLVETMTFRFSEFFFHVLSLLNGQHYLVSLGYIMLFCI